MALKYFNIFQPRALQNLPTLGFFGLKKKAPGNPEFVTRAKFGLNYFWFFFEKKIDVCLLSVIRVDHATFKSCDKSSPTRHEWALQMDILFGQMGLRCTTTIASSSSYLAIIL
jgi:hypothetical protein